MNRLIFCARVKINNFNASGETEKIAYEYFKNGNWLISKIEVVWQNSDKTSSKLSKLINQFLLSSVFMF